MSVRAGSLAEFSPVRNEMIGRQDENSTYKHVSPVVEIKYSVLIGRQFAFGRISLGKRDKISQLKTDTCLT